MTTKWRFAVCAVCCAMAATGFSRTARAGSFQLYEGSPDQNANAFAGQGAKAYDAGASWANPAGMVLVDGIEVDNSLNYIDPQFYFTGNNSNFPNPAAQGAPNQHVSAIYGALTPSYFSVVGLSPDLKFGLAVKSPFGARIEYNPEWVGRFQSINSTLTDIQFEPSVGYAMTRKFSLGGGPVFDYISLRETQGVLPLVGGNDGDIHADVKGTDWSVGYNVAGLYQIDPDTRFGVSYRSRIEHRVDIEQSLTAQPSLAQSPFGSLIQSVIAASNTPGHGVADGVEKFNLPDSIDASFYHQITPEWAVMAEAIWTHWQLFNNITVATFDTPNKPVVNQFDFHNTMFGSVGVSYRPLRMPELLLQTGAGYDQDPVDDSNRTAQIPTDDRVLVAIGFNYQVTPRFSFGASYDHYFGLGGAIDSTGPSLASALELPAGRLTGNYSDQIDTVSAGIKLKF
jgi:long-chain fatty acid transport protein